MISESKIFTFAPEADCQRMRNVINKGFNKKILSGYGKSGFL